MELTLSSQSAAVLRPPSVFPTSHLSRRSSTASTLGFQWGGNPVKPSSLRLMTPKQSRVRASISGQSPPNLPSAPQNLLADSTRTLSTIAALASALSRLFLKHLKTLPILPNPSLAPFSGPLFFASVSYRPPSSPLTVVATGLSKWLDLYSGVLLVRVLLSWFPNIPWDKQPFSALRDLSDPYLSLFRGIIPPVFDNLDISPILGFTILGFVGSLLKTG
ncbi:hypothetical protein Tsubulata_012174 [Turnera subulata]|uniref:YGGT family protein n=1 Tax=Turnera subulata TaxID=218843 RepID=A0A9Q0GDC9_9ROSI|nr:hypothetical protein Tsubulata_012174 [Turnera subulata]